MSPPALEVGLTSVLMFLFGFLVGSCWTRGRGIENTEKDVGKIQNTTENDTEVWHLLVDKENENENVCGEWVWHLPERGRVAHWTPRCPSLKNVRGARERLIKRQICKVCGNKDK